MFASSRVIVKVETCKSLSVTSLCSILDGIMVFVFILELWCVLKG